MPTSFPRLCSLDVESSNYKKIKRLNKDVLLAQLFQLQNDLDAAHGKVAQFEAKAESQSLKDWSDFFLTTFFNLKSLIFSHSKFPQKTGVFFFFFFFFFKMNGGR